MIEVEVPAYYVESITSVALTGWHVLNFSPADTGNEATPWFPGDVIGGLEPPRPDCFIEFDVLHVGETVAVDPTGLSLSINGVVAISGGVIEPSFEGAITAPRSDSLHVRVRPTVPYTSRQHVTPIVTMLDPSAPAVSRTWVFVVADVVPPTVYGVVGRDVRVVRATWSEEVMLLDATVPNRYVLEPIQADDRSPALTPLVLSVSVVVTSQVTIVDLFTDVELTPGTTYRLTTSGVHDLNGNATTASITFPAFVPPRPPGRSFDLWWCLPLLNRQEDATHDLERFIKCLQVLVDQHLYEIDLFTTLYDVDTAPIVFVEAMLEDLGNPFPFVLSDIDKRRLVHLLVAIYADKGTERGIINVVRFFVGVDVHIEDYVGGDMVLGISVLGTPPPDAAPGEYWILGPGTTFALYAFRVVVNGTNAIPYPVLTEEQRFQIRTLTNYMKPAHTHFVELVEPRPPIVIDHLMLGVSRLGDNWLLH